MTSVSPQTEIPMDLSCSSSGSKSRNCCSCERIKDIRTWVKVVAWFSLVFGAFCAVALIRDIYVAVQKLVHSNFRIESTSNHEEMENKMNAAKLYTIAGLVVKIIHQISYLAKAVLGMLLLLKKEDRNILKKWIIITFTLLLTDLTIFITPILVFPKKFDYVAVLFWQLPLVWILTIVSLFVVYVFRSELKNADTPAADALPFLKKYRRTNNGVTGYSTTEFMCITQNDWSRLC